MLLNYGILQTVCYNYKIELCQILSKIGFSYQKGIDPNMYINVPEPLGPIIAVKL
jgi:hypothetical protein